jgi:hypothetical protein
MQRPACPATSESKQSIVQTIAMEKATGFEQVEQEHMGSSLEQESEPVKTIAEKEIAVQNVGYADAVKDLSPWVGIGKNCIRHSCSDSKISRRDTSNCTSV